MKDSKPEWYGRLKNGPFDEMVFDSEMWQKVQQRIHSKGAIKSKRRLNPWIAAGVAVIVLVVCASIMFPGTKAPYVSSKTGGSASAGMTEAYFHENFRVGMTEHEVTRILGEPSERKSVMRDFPQSHREDPKDLSTWVNLSTSRYDYGVSQGYKVRSDVEQPDGFDLTGLENGEIKSQLVIVWNKHFDEIERAMLKYKNALGGLVTTQIGPGVEEPSPQPWRTPTDNVRAVGESSYGAFVLRPIVGSKETIQPLGAPSCLGLETDVNIRGDYEMFFTDKSGGVQSVYSLNGLEFIQHDEMTVTMREYEFSDMELFLLIPRYTDCHGLEVYAFGVDKKSGKPSILPFKTREQIIPVWTTSPVNLPKIENDRLIIEGGRAAGTDGATRYTFKPDLARRALMLESQEQIP